METGEIDIAYDIDGLDKIKIAEDPKLNLVEDLDLSVTYLGFNLRKAPFDNLKVRQAIAYAIDQQPIVDTVFQGAAFPANSIIGPKIFAHSDKGIKYQQDLEKAKILLAEAGYKDGFKTEIWINDNPTRRDIAVILQDQLKQIGIDAEVKTLEWELTWTERLGDHQMYILGWGTVTADPDYGINALVTTKAMGAAGNRSFYSNPKVDELLQKGRATTEPKPERLSTKKFKLSYKKNCQCSILYILRRVLECKNILKDLNLIRQDITEFMEFLLRRNNLV